MSVYKNSNFFAGIVGALIFCFFYSLAGAHDIPISEIRLVSDESQVHLELKLNAFELTFISEIDQNKNGRIEKNEFYETREAITKRLLDALEIEIAGAIVEAETSGVMWDANSHHLVFRAHYPADNPAAASLKLTSGLQVVTSRSHVTWVSYGSSGDQQRARLEARSNSVRFNPAVTGKQDGLPGAFLSRAGLIVVCIGLVIGGVFYGLKRSIFSSHVTKSNY